MLVPEPAEQVIHCDVGRNQSYDIHLTSGLLAGSNPLLAEICGARRLLVGVDSGVWALYLSGLTAYLERYQLEYHLVPLAISEHNKDISIVQRVCAEAQKHHIGRRDVFLAIGGGATLDVVGLAAHLYRRGVAVIKVPTTVLAAMDAAVGTKTGVNFLGHRNLLGAFSPPLAVAVDMGFFRTLPQRVVQSGLAEVLKLGCVVSAQLFKDLERFSEGPADWAGFNQLLEALVRDAIDLTVRELMRDPYESRLARTLDFGHTFSPMLETVSGHELHHGEAVAIDIALCALLARERGVLPAEQAGRIIQVIGRLRLPRFHEALANMALLREQLNFVREHRGGDLNLVLPAPIGTATFVQAVDSELLRTAAIELESA